MGQYPNLTRRIDGIFLKRKVFPKLPSKPKFKGKILFFFLFLTLFLASIALAVRNFQKIALTKILKDGHYLVLFQNNTELRSSGGFIGSFATFDFQQGKIKNITFETNIYKRDQAFVEKKKIAPPEPIKKITPYWAMRDSNWDVSFPQAARRVAWFYLQEGGERVDGVIALDTNLLRNLLILSGPIIFPEYQTTINAENFVEVLQWKIEKEYFQTKEGKEENEPKKILKDLFSRLVTKLDNPILYPSILQVVKKGLKEKNLLFYFFDSSLQKIVEEQNWAGAVLPSSSDYLYLVNNNLGGAKSSQNVSQEIRYQVKKINSNPIANLTVTRIHSGSYRWPDGENINYLKILVPFGSKLLGANLDEVDIKSTIEESSEAGKTVFATWVNTAPQTSHVLNLSYLLPLEGKSWTLLVQKQPGSPIDKLEVIFKDRIIFSGLLDSDIKISL